MWVVPVRAEGPLGWSRGISLLGRADRERADRFVNQADRNRLAVSRAAAARPGGESLVRRTGRACPTSSTRSGGRPRWQTAICRLSVAHAGDLVVCAAAERPIGVDVEAIPGPTPTEALRRRVLSARERHALTGVSPGSENVEFLRLWVRKEAVLKAVGTATSDDLARIDVREGHTSFPGPSRTMAAPRARPWDRRTSPPWR